MLSTRLTTIDQGILSNTSIPAILRPLIERRTNNKRIFGKLEIIAPQFEDVAPATKTDTAAATAPRRIIAGFLLDNSGSMQGRKIQLAEILLSERDQGKTIASQPIHSWIYVITFNSDAELVIPFQEITADTLPNILAQLDQIRTTGCTNYERAFKKQTEVIRGIPPPTGGSYHLIRFFGTDGEITEGTRRTEILYKMMRDTDAAYLNDTDAVVGGRNPRGTPAELPLTFEDYILGYGTDVDLNCLKTLASPYQRSEYMADRTHANRKPQYTDAYNCSSLITIVKPEDIGWQMGELLFKVIMRYGYKVQVSISATDATTTDATADDEGRYPQLFEYQSHQWSNTTTLHSIIHGEKKTMYIQYTPPSSTDAAAVLVNIQYSNQFTGSTYIYEFEHTIIPSPTTDAATDADISVSDLPIIGMIQIEIFKQFREIEASGAATGGSKYDKDTIVREAYKTIRMLKSLQLIESTPLIENLITDVKVIIGLTTIQDKKETEMVLHARRICSAEQEVFNTGANISRKYVDGEEEHEEEAARVIKSFHDAAAADADAAPDNDNDNDNDNDEELVFDAIHSRITTVIDTPYSQTGYGRGQSSRSNHRHHHRHHDGSSELRTLCARIAMAKKDKEDFTTEQLYEQVRRYGIRAGYHQHTAANDDQFSSTPMDDEYTQRRMGMMRQMSSQSPSQSSL